MHLHSETPHPYTHHLPTQNATSKLIFLLLSLHLAHPAWKLAGSPDVCLPNHQSDPLSLMPLKNQSCKQLVNAAWHIITAASADLQAWRGKHWREAFSLELLFVFQTGCLSPTDISLYASMYTGRVKGHLLHVFWKGIFNMVSQKLLLSNNHSKTHVSEIQQPFLHWRQHCPGSTCDKCWSEFPVGMEGTNHFFYLLWAQTRIKVKSKTSNFLCDHYRLVSTQLW